MVFSRIWHEFGTLFSDIGLTAVAVLHSPFDPVLIVGLVKPYFYDQVLAEVFVFSTSLSGPFLPLSLWAKGLVQCIR